MGTNVSRNWTISPRSHVGVLAMDEGTWGSKLHECRQDWQKGSQQVHKQEATMEHWHQIKGGSQNTLRNGGQNKTKVQKPFSNHILVAEPDKGAGVPRRVWRSDRTRR